MAARLSVPVIPPEPITVRLLTPPKPAAPRREPLWVRKTWDATRHEVTSYLRTAWAFGTRPEATARAWVEGRFDALNPLAYLLNSLALIGPWRALWQRILGMPEVAFTQDLVAASTPFLGILIAGSLHHLLFRLLGSKRHIESSWAISIYSTGGLPTVVSLVATPFSLHAQRMTTPSLLLAHWHELVLLQAFGLVTLVMQNAALAGLYGTSRKRAAAVQVGSFVGLAFVAAQFILAGVALHRLADRF